MYFALQSRPTPLTLLAVLLTAVLTPDAARADLILTVGSAFTDVAGSLDTRTAPYSYYNELQPGAQSTQPFQTAGAVALPAAVPGVSASVSAGLSLPTEDFFRLDATATAAANPSSPGFLDATGLGDVVSYGFFTVTGSDPLDCVLNARVSVSTLAGSGPDFLGDAEAEARLVNPATGFVADLPLQSLNGSGNGQLSDTLSLMLAPGNYYLEILAHSKVYSDNSYPSSASASASAWLSPDVVQSPSAAPEPSGLTLSGVGGVGLVLFWLRKRAQPRAAA